MRSCRAAAFGVLLVASARPVRADTAVRGFVTAGVGVSDNATFQAGAGAQRVTAATFELRPGVAALVTEKRDQHLVGALVQLTLVADQAATQTYAAQVLWRWAHEATARDLLVFETSATFGRTSPFYFVATSGGPLSGAAPQVTRFVSATIRETWTRQLSKTWTSAQALSGSVFAPLDADATAQSWSIDASGAFARAFARDVARFELGATHVLYRAITVPGSERAEAREVLARAITRWTHDVDPYLQTQLSVGVAAVASTDALGSAVVGPTAAASLRRTFGEGYAALTVSHAQASNLYLGATQIIDEASLAALAPVDRRRRFVLTAAAAYGHGRNVVAPGLAAADGAYHYYRVDAGVLHVISNGLRVALHAQRLDERADAASVATAPSFVSDSVMLDFTATLPQPESPRGAPF